MLTCLSLCLSVPSICLSACLRVRLRIRQLALHHDAVQQLRLSKSPYNISRLMARRTAHLASHPIHGSRPPTSPIPQAAAVLAVLVTLAAVPVQLVLARSVARASAAVAERKASCQWMVNEAN